MSFSWYRIIKKDTSKNNEDELKHLNNYSFYSDAKYMIRGKEDLYEIVKTKNIQGCYKCKTEVLLIVLDPRFQIEVRQI